MRPPRPKSRIMLRLSTKGGETTGSILTTLKSLRTKRERMSTYTST